MIYSPEKHAVQLKLWTNHGYNHLPSAEASLLYATNILCEQLFHIMFTSPAPALTWYLDGTPVAVATAICAYWLIGLLYPTADRGLRLTWVGSLE